MKTNFPIVLALLAFTLHTSRFTLHAQSVITATYAVTNSAGTTNGNTVIVQGTTYLWTNSPSSLSHITNSGTAPGAATNLYNKFRTALTNRYMVSYGSSTSVLVKTYVGQTITSSISTNWGLLTFATNTAGNASLGASNLHALSITLGGTTIDDWTDVGSGGGTSGALTNNETRAVTFESTLTIGGGSSQNPIAPSAGQLTFANSIAADGAFIQGRTIIGTNFVGNGAGLTNLPDVATQDELAAGSLSINEQALTGFLRFSSTNTAFLDGANTATNAITVVSNINTYASFVVPSKVNLGVNIGGTYYRKSYGVYTNGAIGAVFIDSGTLNESAGSINFTNAAHATPDADVLAFVVSGNSFLWFDTSDEILDEAGNPFSPSVFPTTVTQLSTPSYASFNGKHVGDGSALVNLPTPSGVITNNWQSSAGQINLTNAIRPTSINMGYDYGISLNYRAGAGDNTNYIIITNGAISLPGAGNNGIYGTVSGVLWPEGYISYNAGWILMRSAKFSMEHTADFSHVRFGDDHRQDQLVKLALSGVGETHGPTNQYSAMLGFHSIATSGYQGMSGIQGRHEDGNATSVYNIGGVNYTESETWFFSLIPEPKAHTNGGWGTNDLGRAYMVGRKDGAYFNKAVLATNGISSFSTVAAAAITATGWTNIWSTNNATVYVERGASVSVTLKNRANATLNTFTAGTAPLTISLQPGWGLTASGNLSGNAVPF